MKTSKVRLVQSTLAMVAMGLFVLACAPTEQFAFGESCETSSDCVSSFCVGGEAGTQLAPFCSDDCAGKETGDACGDGRGKCIADFVSWCWMPCETNSECVDVNPERSQCSVISSNGVQSPFKVCIAKQKM